MQQDSPSPDEMGRDLVDIVGGVLFCGSRILLGKRAATRQSHPNVWDVVGGHVEAHEQPINTLSRELQEEIGVTPTDYFLLERFYHPALKQHGVHRFYLYVVTSWTGTP